MSGQKNPDLPSQMKMELGQQTEDRNNTKVFEKLKNLQDNGVNPDLTRSGPKKVAEQSKTSKIVNFYNSIQKDTQTPPSTESNSINTAAEMETEDISPPTYSKVMTKNCMNNAEDTFQCKKNTCDTEGHEQMMSPIPVQKTRPVQDRKHSYATCLCKECVENYSNISQEKKTEGEKKHEENLINFSDDSTVEKVHKTICNAENAGSSKKTEMSVRYVDAQITKVEDRNNTQEYEKLKAPPDNDVNTISTLSESQKVVEQNKTPKSVSFQDSEAMATSVQTDTQAPSFENDGNIKAEKMENGDVSSQTNDVNSKNHMDNAQDTLQCEVAKCNTVGSEQTMPPVPAQRTTFLQFKKLGYDTCLSKESGENSRSHEILQEQTSEEEKRDEEKQIELFSDSTSEDVRKRICNTEISRNSSTSEETEMTNGYEDAQVTLPYPYDKKTPEPITRLSNAGLYEQNKYDGDDNKCQELNPSVFVQDNHQHEKHSNNVQKKENMEMHEMDIENGNHEARPLLNPTCTRSVDEESLYLKPQCCRFDRVCLKIVLSFIISVIILPPLMYGAYALLPFDVPVMPDVTTRLVYTLRCGVFASFPIVLGVIIQGISRLCTSYFDPFKPKVREVTIHQRFVKQGTFLFVLYIFNLAVLATYLPQDYLKLIPLLICLFVISQLIYWLSFAVGRPFRSFGYGMTFVPLVCMLACNLFFIFIVDPHKMVFLGKETNSEAKVKSSG